MAKKITSLKLAQVKTRTVWSINPITRVKPSKKVYSRKKYKRIVLDGN